MRCGLLSVDVGDRPPTKRDGTRRRPDGARLPVLFRSPSGGEPRTWQNFQPCSPPPPLPRNGRFTILLQYRNVLKKGVPPACRSMSSINCLLRSYTTQCGKHVPTFWSIQSQYTGCFTTLGHNCRR
jgi:hypothetical protein